MGLTGNFTGQGIKPQVLSARAIGPALVRVTFSEAMEVNSGLISPSSYVLGAGVGSVERTVSAVAPQAGGSPTYVDLTLSGELTAGEDNYTVTVSWVNDLAGNPLDGDHDEASFGGFGSRPRVVAVRAFLDDLTKLRVVFSEAVKQVSPGNSDDALNPANYSITSPVVVQSVSNVQSNIVELLVSGQVAGGSYELTVQNIEDLSNNVVEP